MDEIHQPFVDNGVDDEVDAVRITGIRDRVRIAETQIPALAFAHRDALAVQAEVDTIVRHNGHVPADAAAPDLQLQVHMDAWTHRATHWIGFWVPWPWPSRRGWESSRACFASGPPYDVPWRPAVSRTNRARAASGSRRVRAPGDRWSFFR